MWLRRLFCAIAIPPFHGKALRAIDTLFRQKSTYFLRQISDIIIRSIIKLLRATFKATEFSEWSYRKLLSNRKMLLRPYQRNLIHKRNPIQLSAVADNSSYMTKVEKLRAFHARIEKCLKPLPMVAEKDFPVATQCAQ